jgi:hypothetical protein
MTIILMLTKPEAELLAEMTKEFIKAGIEDREKDPQIDQDLPILYAIVRNLESQLHQTQGSAPVQ